MFFDHLGVVWQYEPEGFDLGSGHWYLPDFWLPDLRIWLEVKGHGASDGIGLWERFAQAADPPSDADVAGGVAPALSVLPAAWRGRALLAYGDIPRPGDARPGGVWPAASEAMLASTGDPFFQWCICLSCGRVGAEFDGRWERICCGHSLEGGPESSADHPRLLAAYRAAREKSFEHEHRER
ncbi:hypothetical protein AB0903_28030 [Streptomyces sp. NPDC048389]|uniref:hypothetical protein n=1 Tax=Streptomyces sp. NPDC048389 TaxID=3154622 RepID=UPI0034562F75